MTGMRELLGMGVTQEELRRHLRLPRILCDVVEWIGTR